MTDGETFLLALAQALHQAGLAAHRIEDVLGRVAERLGQSAQFFSTPTALIVATGSLDEQRTSLLRVEPRDVNLERMTALDTLVEDVLAGREEPRQAAARLQAIADRPPRYRGLMIVPSFALVSAAACVFFGGGLLDVAVAAVIGLLIGLLSIALASGSRRLVFEFVAAGIAAAVAGVCARSFAGAPFVATVAGLIVLVPGLTLTIAINELATVNLVSGTARLMSAAIVFLKIAVGVALGARLAAVIPVPELFASSVALPPGADVVALIAAAGALVVLFQAPPRAAGWILVACALAFWGARLGAYLLGPELGAWVGAFAVGVLSNAFARFGRGPAAVPQVPAILLLVPGSVGFRSLQSFLSDETLSAVDTAFTMFLIAAAIVTGLLMANVLVPPRRSL